MSEELNRGIVRERSQASVKLLREWAEAPAPIDEEAWGEFERLLRERRLQLSGRWPDSPQRGEERMLTQQEADALLALPKRFADAVALQFPAPGDSLTRGLMSLDGNESFLLDINRRGRIRLAKCTYQERCATTIVLVRLDLGGRPHTNPDGTEVPCPHLHVYREGYEARWAEPVSTNVFTDTSNLGATLADFLTFCNVRDVPPIQGVLI